MPNLVRQLPTDGVLQQLQKSLKTKEKMISDFMQNIYILYIYIIYIFLDISTDSSQNRVFLAQPLLPISCELSEEIWLTSLNAFRVYVNIFVSDLEPWLPRKLTKGGFFHLF